MPRVDSARQLREPGFRLALGFMELERAAQELVGLLVVRGILYRADQVSGPRRKPRIALLPIHWKYGVWRMASRSRSGLREGIRHSKKRLGGKRGKNHPGSR